MAGALRRGLRPAVLRPSGRWGGGTSRGRSCCTDRGRVLVKSNSRPETRRMFLGEMASLEAVLKMQTVRVPKPIKVVELPGDNAVLVMEHLEMKSLNS